MEHIFRSYNIRGIYPNEINEEFAYRLARSFSIYMKRSKKIAVGRDVRISGEKLKYSLINGFVDSGKEVIDLDLVPTSVVHFFVSKNKTYGACVTASHNPPNWNGFKFFNKDASHCFYGNGLEKVKEIFFSKENFDRKFSGKKVDNKEIIEKYIEEIVSKVKIEGRIKVVVDCSNGTHCLTAKKAFSYFDKVDVKFINDFVDGNFPSHSPEPNEESIKQLTKEVIENKFDLGIFFDADGDRAAFVDDKGRYVAGDLALIIYYLSLENKKINVVQSINCTNSLKEIVEENGGKVFVERVGNVFLIEKMKDVKAFIGGERSSHFFFKEFYYIDDGLFSALKMLEALSRLNSKMSEIIDKVNKYYFIPPYEAYKIPCKDEKKFLVVEMVKDELRKVGFEIIEIDGVKAVSNDGWISIRASNTEPLIKLTVEGKDKEKAEKLFYLGKSLVEKYAS